jgi:ATP-dependent DNA ligase
MVMPWHLSVARSRHPPLPAGFIAPCRPTLVRAPPAGPGWLHEVKHDGFRILARKQGERVDVWSRRGALFNDRFPSIAEAVGALPVANALIDGEAVTFLPDGHSDFAALRTKEGGERAAFVAFDLLDLEGEDFRDRPLEERRDALARSSMAPPASGSAKPYRPMARSCSPTPARWASKGSCRSAPAAAIAAERAATG